VSKIVHAIAAEVASQPACWRRAARVAGEAAGELPQPGERVAAVGCGTSLYMARAFAALREHLGQGETDAFPASEFPSGRRYDRLVAISRSGTTTEVLRLLGKNHGSARSVVITADGGAPVGALADASIVLDFADERSVVQTRFATSALALLRAHVGDDLASAINDTEAAVEGSLPIEPNRFDHFVFLGHGWSVGIAEEAALKLREAAQAHTEAYPAMEYRHGPISVAGPRSLVWILGSPDPAVADDAASTGATIRIGSLDPMAELVLVQLVATALAESRGLDPDHPRHLARSVVLRPAVDGSDPAYVEQLGKER
jgi:fructoselysine-6-P-deglycase FrlB-like protein